MPYYNIFVQGVEYSVSSFTISDGAFGSCFYFGTGFPLAPIKNFNRENAKDVANKLSPFWVTGFSFIFFLLFIVDK